ncbi:hypothetical protein TNCV_1631421 [Trichonephila clavipes]|nr:hypothetical protein TNCV_1631421 [Trichonephila clavipes]
MSAYVGIGVNEAADELDKAARDLNINNSKCHVTLDDANATARYRLKEKNIKTRTYVKCRYCPDEEIAPSPNFNCPAILASLQNIGEYPFDADLYKENIVMLA